jgi:hypothetical protein
MSVLPHYQFISGEDQSLLEGLCPPGSWILVLRALASPLRLIQTLPANSPSLWLHLLLLVVPDWDLHSSVEMLTLIHPNHVPILIILCFKQERKFSPHFLRWMPNPSSTLPCQDVTENWLIRHTQNRQSNQNLVTCTWIAICNWIVYFKLIFPLWH